MNKHTKVSAVPCFKRWSRKSWSVFASLHRVVKIGVLASFMSILTLPFKTLLAQVDSLQIVVSDSVERDKAFKYNLNEVHVTARLSNPTRGIIVPTEVYNRDLMKTSAYQSIEGVLKTNPSVDLRERGGKGVQADISLYGGTSDQTMLMLNGINFTDARTGHQTHSLPVDIEQVNSINLISGVAGIGAFTGALNVITTPENPNYIKTIISGGSYGYLYGNISGAISKNGVSSMISGSIKKSDGYIDNTDFNNVNLFTRTVADGGKYGNLDFQAGYQKKYFGANAFYSLTYPHQAEKTQTYLTSLKWSKSVNDFKFRAFASYRRNTDKFELFRDLEEAPAWYGGHNYHLTDNVGAGLSVAYNWIGGTSTIGADYSYNLIYSNVLGEDMSSTIPVAGEHDKYYTKSAHRNVINGWLRHNVLLGKFDLSGSFNMAGSTKDNSMIPSYMWSLAASYSVLPGFLIDLSASQSMRLPTFTDLYYTTATHIGNVDLNPETAITYRLGSSFKTPHIKHLRAAANVYYRQGKNIIDWILKDGSDKWESSQMTKLNTFGADVSISYGFDKILKDISVSYGYVSTDKNSQGYTSKYALDYMKNKFSSHILLEFIPKLTLDITGSWYDRSGNFVPYFLLDARLSWSPKIFSFFIDANNILNTKYYDFGGLAQPGIWVVGGVSICISSL
jgi:vitamin B12 transporter